MGDFPDRVVFEGALKVFHLSHDTAMTGAGDAESIETIAEVMKRELLGGASLFDASERARAAAGAQEFEVVLGSASGGGPGLFVFTCEHELQSRGRTTVTLGNRGAVDHVDISNFAQGLKGATGQMDILAAMTGVILSKTAHCPEAFAGGVGGPLFGMVYENGQLRWQDDVVALFLTEELLDSLVVGNQPNEHYMDLVWLMVRGGVGMAASSFLARAEGVQGQTTIRCFTNAFSDPVNDCLKEHETSVTEAFRGTNRIVLVSKKRIDNIGLYNGAAHPASPLKVFMTEHGCALQIGAAALQWMRDNLKLDRRLYCSKFPHPV